MDENYNHKSFQFFVKWLNYVENSKLKVIYILEWAKCFYSLPEKYITSLFEFQTLSASDLRDPDISALIATKMKEFHDLEMPGPKDVILWGRLRYISVFSPIFPEKLLLIFVSNFE